jgi:amidase
MKTLSKNQENTHFYIDARNKPRLWVKPEESFCIETICANNMFLNREQSFFKDSRKTMDIPANPVTGPVYIEGAEPGDRLEVHIEDIELNDSGNEDYYTYVPGQGLIANRFASKTFPPDTYFCKIAGNTLKFSYGSDEITAKAQPFIGTICVAMKEKVSLSNEANKEMVGNVDCSNIKKGSVIVMPVNVPGAFLSLGDLHARQGHGELLGCAVESDGVVRLSVKLIKKRPLLYYELPQANGNGWAGSICTVPNNIDAAIRGAVYDVIKRTEIALKIPFMEAYMIAGLCIKIQICQMITKACTAYAYVDRPFLKSI